MSSPMPSPQLPVEVRRARRALEHYGEVRDRAEALLTIPSDTTPRAHLAGTARRPVVEPDLWRLHVRYARTRDEATLTELVERYRPHAEAQARHAYRHGEPIDDLTQVAYEALVRALHRFRPSLRTPFLAFAKPTIVGSLRRHVRHPGRAIRAPGRPPTASEIADFLGVDEREVLEARVAEDVRTTASLDAPDGASGLQTDQVVGLPDRGFAGIENRTALAQSLERLSDDDRALLHMYFVEERTQTQIAEVLGCSQMQVSRLLRKAVRQLRRHMLGT